MQPNKEHKNKNIKIKIGFGNLDKCSSFKKIRAAGKSLLKGGMSG